MQGIPSIRVAIYEIGREMVDCGKQCEGVGKNKQKGVLPRCLYFEDGTNGSDRGVVIVGLNPGNSWPAEQEFYITHKKGPSYDAVLDFWDVPAKPIKNVLYYRRLRNLAKQLGLLGPILWTELAKCEDKVKGIHPPIETFRVCTETFLRRELAIIPGDWPLIGVSDYVYQALAFNCTDRVVIGVHHARSRFGSQFTKMFDANKKLLPTLRPPWDYLWDGQRGRAVWLDAAGGRVR